MIRENNVEYNKRFEGYFKLAFDAKTSDTYEKSKKPECVKTTKKKRLNFNWTLIRTTS